MYFFIKPDTVERNLFHNPWEVDVGSMEIKSSLMHLSSAFSDSKSALCRPVYIEFRVWVVKKAAISSFVYFSVVHMSHRLIVW